MPPDDARHAPGWSARLALAFRRDGARSVLGSRRHEGPLVVQKALYPEGESVCHAIVVHPPGGIAGGDTLAIDVRLEARAQALLTTPGAAKWYRSAGAAGAQRVTLALAPGSALEWLPQESIVFDGAIADIAWEARLEGDARLIAWDVFCLGRTGSGERFTQGRCRLSSRLWRDGKLAWSERGTISPATPAMSAAPGLAHHPVFGTMLAAAPQIADATLAACRAVAAADETAVTRLPGLLVARYRGGSSAAARAYFSDLWHILREPLLGLEAVAPRIWST